MTLEMRRRENPYERAFRRPETFGVQGGSVEVVDLVRKRLGRRLSAAEIGSKTFDYYVKTECAE